MLSSRLLPILSTPCARLHVYLSVPLDAYLPKCLHMCVVCVPVYFLRVALRDNENLLSQGLIYKYIHTHSELDSRGDTVTPGKSRRLVLCVD